MDPIPKDIKLYNKIKKEIYRLYPKHSLFRSAMIVKIYKNMGGEYENKKQMSKGINEWFTENWISVNDYYHNNKIVPCGSSNTEEKYNSYPLCRPEKIVKQLTKPQMKKMIDEKNKLKEKHLVTEKILKTKKFNIRRKI